MGVVYKFKKEVIDFVLQQKRENYALSCRQLAVLTSEKFKLQLSKSSVNFIIKNAHLSSTVGRRLGLEQGPKKFQIPSQKKKQLFDEISRVGLIVKVEPVAAPQAPLKKTVVLPKSLPMVFAPPQSVSRPVEHLRDERPRTKGPLCPEMGYVFLKAAQWELSRAPILGKLVRKYIHEQISSYFDAACDALPCLSLLEIDHFRQIGRFSNHALWVLSSPFLSFAQTSEVLNRLNQVPFPRRFFLECEEEKNQVSAEASEFHIFLEDGSQITADARLIGLWSERTPSSFSAPLEQAMSGLSHYLVSNNQPAVFLSSVGRPPAFAASSASSPESGDLAGGGLPSEGKEQFHQDIWNMVAACEGLKNKRMARINVLGPSREELATFSSFPAKKRIFMLGIEPRQKEFGLLLKDAKTLEPFYSETLGRTVYVKGWLTNMFQERLKGVGPMRAIAISTSSSQRPQMIILTNWIRGSAREGAVVFLERWPYLNEGPAGRSLALGGGTEFQPRDFAPASGQPAPFFLANQQTDFFAICRDFGDIFQNYCLRRFFTVKHGKDSTTKYASTVYSIPGCCSSSENGLWVFLKPPSGYEHLRELHAAVERVNESNVADPWGRELVLYIE